MDTTETDLNIQLPVEHGGELGVGQQGFRVQSLRVQICIDKWIDRYRCVVSLTLTYFFIPKIVLGFWHFPSKVLDLMPDNSPGSN